MTTTNEELKALAERAIKVFPATDDRQQDMAYGRAQDEARRRFALAASPSRVLALLEEVERKGWQPIEAAPDDAHMLVFVPMADQPSNLPRGSVHVAYKTHPAPPLVQTWRYANGPGRGEQIGWPTHWQPLPEPPTND